MKNIYAIIETRHYKKLLFVILLLAKAISSFSEGTKQIQPTSGDVGMLVLDNGWSNFAQYGCLPEERLQIRTCNNNEKIYFGFRYLTSGVTVKYRLKDQFGNVVMGPANIPTSGAGYIGSYNAAVAGPTAIAGATGYTALSYTAPTAGDYYIEFSVPSGTRVEFDYFDITVSNPAGNTAIPGRVWSKSWMLSAGNYGTPFKGKFFVYADDSIVTSLDFNGMAPYVFVLNANKTGTSATGNPAVDQQSKKGKATYPQYRVFLNNPDESCYPTGSFGNITSPTTISGCPPTNFCINVSVNRPGTAQIYMDLNGVPGHQAGTRDRIISSAVNPPGGCIPWDGKDGLGNFVTQGFSFKTTVEFYNGLTHIPLYDVEQHPNGYKVALVRPTGPVPKLYWDDSQIPNGTMSPAGGATSPAHTWNWTCCNNSANDYGNTNTINTWWYADSTREITTHFVPPLILVDADTRPNSGTNGKNDTLICGTNSVYNLSGGVVTATGGIWSTTGTGTFTPNNTNLIGAYNISAADRAAGLVKLVLTSTGNGACAAVSDTLVLRFQPIPTASAGSPATVCANNPAVILTGSISNATGGIWSGGTGTFSPSNTTLNATYTPSAAEIAAGNVTLTLTSTGNNKCAPVASPVPKAITIIPAPTVSTGPAQTVCKTSPAITLAGSTTNSTSSTWSGGAGTFSPNANTLNATYTPTAAEVAAGTVNLTLSASQAGCTTVSGNVTMTFGPSPTSNAGVDQTVCFNNSNVTLNGAVTNASSFSWSGGAGTFTPNNTTLNAVYSPTLAERTTGSVTLTLTANRVGCTSVPDNMIITIAPAPTVNAGIDGTVCENKPQFSLSGTSSTGSGHWTGLGTFVPNANITNPTYTPDASELAAGIASVIWTSTNNTNGCLAANDTILIFVTPSPTANAGPDISVCANNPTVNITGTRTNASSSLWSGGNGTFAPNTNSLAITYTPSASEISSGSITLTLTSSRNTCNSVSDNMVITITPAPTIDAGADQSICYNNPNVSLNGTVTVATGGTWSGGNGTYSPSNQLVTNYTPTTAELNSGTINLTLTSSGNNGCNAVTDQMTIHVTPSPSVNAGTPQSVCSNNATVTLNGSKTIAGGGIWSGGAGTFTPNNTTLNATYTPTAAEINGGTVTLTLTTTGTGNCNPVNSNVTIGITPAPTVNAGPDQTVCATTPSVVLSGSKTVATGGVWSGGAGTFLPNNTTLNATYVPTLGEITAGTVTLTLTTTGNTSNCNAVSDQMIITIVPAANAQAGADQIICASGSNVSLNGAVSGATGGVWTTSGSGTFSPNATKLNATYIPSASDKTSGTITLTLTTTGMAPCGANSDQMIVSITGVPSISAGPNQIVCTNDFPVQLNASGSPATWSGGSGTFSNVNSLTSTYTPSPAEINTGNVTLTITTNPSGACPTVNDKVKINILPSPTVNAGPDMTVCGNLNGATLSGSVTNTAGGFWTTSGTGSFSPNNTTLNAIYVPSALDKTNGTVQLTLTSTGSGACSQVTDQMILTIQPTITVNAGPDQTVCADISGISLNGASVTNAAGISWTSSGTGTFLPNATTLNATYVPSTAEKTAGTVTLTISTTGNGMCPVITDNVTFTITPAPVVNAGADQTICADAANVTLNGSKSAGFGIIWTSSGSGTFSPNATTTNAVYTPSSADKTAGTVTLTVTSTGNGTCNAVTDNMLLTITPKPTASAGIDQTVCADIGSISLTSTVTVVGSGTWSTSGNGTFANANSLNTTYTLGSNDITNGIVTLTLTSATNGVCGSVTDQLVVTILDAPIVNAGSDQNICSNNSNVHLLGSVTNATGGVWSGGAGTFNPGNTNLTPNYTPTAAEIASGSLTLTLTSTGNGLCKPKVDQMVINFTPAPTVNAGPDKVICADSIGIALNGTTTISPTGLWTTSGSGNFFPNSAVANPTYMPSPSDRTAGTVTLTYTTNNNGNCNAVNDQMVLSITPAPTLNAGPDQIVCGNNANISLAVVKTVAGGVQWTTGGTGTFGNANADNTSYNPSALDIAAGSVTLTAVTTGNGSCRSVTDQLILTITPAPTVNAGADRTVCANNPDVALNGSFTVATGINWTTSGSGVFSPNANNRLAVYTPSPSDIASGTVTLTLTTTGNGLCNAVTDQMIITITPAPVITAGPDKTVCADVAGVTLNGSITNAGGVIWSSNGTGIFSPNTTALNPTYKPSAADTAAKSVRFIITSTGIGNCLVVKDTMVMTILPKPIVNAGKDTIVCANAEFIDLSGSVANATGAIWTGNGSGYFTPNANTLKAQYIPSGAETNGGTVTLTLTSTGMGTCNPVSDQMVITLTPLPTANAGPDQTLCANKAVVTINGTITNSPGATWVSSGDGTFANANALSTTYTPSANDIASGSVNLTLTTNGASVCHSNSDQLTITFTPAPIVNAGADQTICANNSNINLNGNVTIASGGKWTSSGSGTFTPSNTSMNAVYHPSATDINGGAGSITLTLTSTGNGSCATVANQMQVNFTPAPTVNAGVDQSICANNANVTLSGVVTVASGGKWTTSGTGTFANANAVATTYTPSASDITGGTITLTLTSTGNGNCSAIADQMIVTITPAPTINAGPDQTICANNPSATLSGSVSVATGATWTSSGTGTFANANSLSTTYTPSPADTVAKTITLTLTSTGNGNCVQVNDQMVLNITPAPKTNAGPDQTLCSNNASSISLSGSISVASGGTWTTSGSGTFTNNNSLSTSYTPSAADISSTTTTLTLTSTGNGTCIPVKDDLVLKFTPTPTVNPGTPITVCANTSGVPLNGIITVATGGIWTTASGTGTFSPSATNLNATFVPSATQIANGKANLTLTTTGNGTCNAVSATVLITIAPVPTVNAGTDVSVCTGTPTIGLSGTMTNASGATWSTNGTGTFTPNANTLNATYKPSVVDNVNGKVITLTLTTAAGTCASVNDQMTITFQTTPVNAGSDISVCSNSLPIQLKGSGNGSWSGGNGTFADANSLSTTYMPAANEIPAAGGSPITVTLTLNGAAVGSCIGGTDNVNLVISPGPDAIAGPNQTICANNGVITLNGTVLTATGGKWFSDGTGTFGNVNSLNTTYTASPADTADGSIQLKLVTTGNGTCAADSSILTLNFTPSPKVNAGLDQASCANAGAVTLNGSVTVVAGGTWSGGAGTFSPNTNTLNASYSATAAEIASGAVTLRLTSNIDPVNHCNQVFDEVTITFGKAPTTDAGTDQNVCKNNPIAPLDGKFTVASGIQWSTSGTGSFSPNANDPNATYTASAADLASPGVTITITTTGNGNCIPATDNMNITFTPTPIADAGVDISTCSNNRAVAITGNVTNAAGGTWTSSGTGTFVNANLLSTTYNASAADSAVGSVTLTLTTTGINNCNSVSDQLVITFTPAPIVNAGLDQSSCANAGPVSLNGMVTGAPGGTWSNGAGSFSASNSDLSAFYTPTSAETTAGSITLILTSSANPANNCNPVTDAVTIYFGAAPTADADIDQTICGDGSVTLNGKITIATGGQWTTSGSGIFTPDATTLDAIYVPSSADTLAKTVTLTLTTTGNGNCSPVSDFMVVTITPTPRVNAGTDQTLCADITSVTISGNVTVASGANWTSSGSGTFGNANTSSTTYNPSASDKASGSVFLTLTTTGNGQCNSYSDIVTLFFTPAPTVDAGPDRTVCKDATAIDISGSTTVATGGIWSTSGNGTFDNSNQLSTNYNPSANDKSAGSVTLTLTSQNQGTCNAVTDQLVISFTNAPTVAAGSDRTICTDKDSIRLGGQFTVSSGIVWTTSGNGTFSPSATDPNAVYNFSTTDLNQTNITLTITTSGNGTCNPVTDNLVVDITPKPIIDAGSDINICAGQSNITLNGTVTNYNIANGVIWTTNGTGTFDNVNSLNSGYTPSPADLLKGGLIFTLTTTGGICKPASDVLATNIVPAPVAIVNAGLDQTVCSDVTEIQLAGFISGADYGAWSKPATTGSDGTFIGNNSSDWATAKYQPTNAEITSKTVILRLTTVGNGPICSAVFDDVKISFTDAPTVNAGPDQSICGDNAGLVPLNGSYTVATGGIWSTTGNGVFSLTPAITNPTYYPSPEDKATQSVRLIFTTTGNGTCKPKMDTLLVLIKRPPTVFAGVDQTLCANSVANIRSVITIASGVQWSSSGSGTFGNDLALTTTYTPSPADTAAKEVNLMAVTTGNNGCTPVNDKIRISFSPVPILNAGPDKTVCASNSLIDLSGWVANATGGKWAIASGSGRIINSTSLTPTYIPSAGDTAAGIVTLTMSSTGNGRCTAVTDQVSIFLQAVPVVSMKSVIVCEPKNGAQLSGTVANALGGIWSTTGTGVFATNISDLNGIYYPSPADVKAGQVTLTLESSGNGMCEPVNNSTILNIDPMPIANAGQDHFVCPGSTVVLSAVPSSEGAYQWSVINGATVGNTAAVSVVANSMTTYELVVTNAKGCISKDTVNVDVFTLPTLTLNPEYCLSTTLIIDGIPNPQPNVPGVYNWTLNGETVQGNHTPVISPIKSGNYVLTFAFGTCSVSEPTRVNDHPKLIGDFIKDCIGKSTPITVKANESGLDYSWSTGQAGVDLNTITIPTVLADTTYYIATVTKNYPTISCSAKDSVRIIGIPTPILNLENTDVCQGNIVVLNGRPMNIANLDSLYPSYEWFKDKAIIANQTNDTLTVNVTGEYKEIVRIDQCVAMDSAQINVNPNPTTTLPDYTKFCRRDDNKTVIDAGFVAGNTYLWTAPAGISLDSNNTATITVRKEGVYGVLITNIYNCTLKDSIFVEDLCEPEVDGPNAIIPGDPNNGTFRIYGQYFKNFKLMIFNRWGEVIFQTNNQNEGWDGTYRGQPMPIGVYPYVVTYDSEDPSINKSYKKEGSVTIIR